MVEKIDPRFMLLGAAVEVFNALERAYATSKVDLTELTAQGFCDYALGIATKLREEGKIKSEMFILPQLHVIAQKIGGHQLGREVKLYITERFTQELL